MLWDVRVSDRGGASLEGEPRRGPQRRAGPGRAAPHPSLQVTVQWLV